MSFDLFVYFTPPASGLKERWEGALADEGLPLRFPADADLLSSQDELMVTWDAKPRLITLPPGEEKTYFPYYEIGPRDNEAEEDLARVSPLLRARVEDATHEAFFTTSAGRSTLGLALQVFGAAALAQATRGVLLDPQGGGYMDADEALAYARETLEQYRGAEEAEAAEQVARTAVSERLALRWRWFRGIFFASCAVWAFVVVLVALAGPLGIGVSAPWFPVVTVAPLFGAMVLAAMSTRYFLEDLGVAWPLPGLLGVLSAFPPIHALVYWWSGKRYRRVDPA